ncbi:remorin isoform X1 [Rhododendron vialii]|uniref:remorin isoform X1 n=1 Tax=Rhododendron vialii TaxID=182163 RepID=UPI00265F5D10|nr:remorin isoform X1 [Rhododendron vialii]
MAPHDYDFSYEIEFSTAIAAAAFVIHSVEEADLESENKLRDGTRASMGRVKTRKDDPSMPPESRQISSKEAEGAGEDAMPREPARWAGSNQLERTTRRSPDAKTDAWEKSAMAKLVKRHEKVNSSIIAWEKEKKMKAKVDMERQKRELEQRKAINLLHYQNETARIDHIARGARAQSEDKRRKEESQVRERAKKRIRSKGKVPFGRCFCF